MSFFNTQIEEIVDLPVGQEFKTHLGFYIHFKFDNKMDVAGESLEQELMTYIMKREGFDINVSTSVHRNKTHQACGHLRLYRLEKATLDAV